MYSPATYTVQAITEILAVKFIQWLKATLSRPAFLQSKAAAGLGLEWGLLVALGIC